jgi:hypothetical protein
MSETFLVEMADGTFRLKIAGDIQPEDLLVFDGPGAFSDLEAAQAKLDTQIAAAGGLEAWRKLD